MNGSWGFQHADDDWKSPKTIVRNLLTCTRGGGNYLLNIGPEGNGSIPPSSVEILTSVGRWMDRHSPLIHKADVCKVTRSNFALFTRQGNTLFMHTYFWPGREVAIGGLQQKVLSAKMYTTGQPVKFDQGQWRVRFTGLPEAAPDPLVTTLVIECDGEPTQDQQAIRVNRKREGVGV
jgi:alpha-L-fucosidase